MSDSPKVAVIYIDGGAYLNPYDYSFNEILLAVISETGRQLKQAPYGITIQPSYFTKRIDELKKLLLSDVEIQKLSAGAKSDTFELAADFALRARDSRVVRRKLWEALRRGPYHAWKGVCWPRRDGGSTSTEGNGLPGFGNCHRLA